MSAAVLDPRTPVVVAARRTWIGTAGHGHRDVPAADLAAAVLVAASHDVAQLGVTELGAANARKAGSPGDVGGGVDDVVLGNCTGPGGNLARVAVLTAVTGSSSCAPPGLGQDVPGVTIDRQCGSGLAAVLLAAQAVRAGDGELVLAGGVESASTAPQRAHRRADGALVPYDRAPFTPPELGDPDMGAAADDLAARHGIGRERQEAYAARSHARALAAHAAGRFAQEVTAVGRPDTHGHPEREGPEPSATRTAGSRATLTRDERARRLDPAVLARLPAAFTPGGTVTAGTSSPLSDGAAVVAVVPEEVRRRLGVPGLALRAGATRGCDPRLPGWGPVPAARAVLGRAEASVERLAALELVEAFAAQVLTVTGALDVPDDDPRLNADGGTLALGHPWGASGAVAVVRLFSRLVRGGAPAGTLGLAAAAVGGGLGVAGVFEVVR